MPGRGSLLFIPTPHGRGVPPNFTPIRVYGKPSIPTHGLVGPGPEMRVPLQAPYCLHKVHRFKSNRRPREESGTGAILVQQIQHHELQS